MTLIWQNGEILPLAHLRLDPDDRGFWLAENVFETMAWHANEIRFLSRHRARLESGLVSLGLPLPGESDAEIQRAAGTLCAAGGHESAILRWTITGGPGPRGLAPPTTRAAGAFLRAFARGFVPPLPRIVTVDVPAPAAGRFTRFKSGERLAHVTALRLAREAGADDGLMFNAEGALVCASASNVFVATGGRWLTPLVADGALPGITRGRLLACGQLAGRPIIEAPVTGPMLLAAEALVLTNAIAGARAAASLDNRAFAAPSPRLADELKAFNACG